MTQQQRRQPRRGGSWPERAVAELGARQRLVVARRQLLALGADRNAIARAAASGRLYRYDHGIYALVPLDALPSLAAEQAAILACGPTAVISHRSAGVLWVLIEPARGPVTVTVVGSDAGRWRARIVAHRTAAIDRCDTTRRERLPITTPARTLIDLAAESSTREAELALDRALAKRLTSRTAIREAIARAPRRPGVATIRALLDPGRRTTVTASHAEERLLELVRRGGLPEPEVNASLGDPCSSSALERYRPDLLWREQRVVVEFDSRLYHSGRHAFEGDRRRDAEMTAAGWIVIRFTWTELTEQPERVLVWIATALARRTAAAA